MRPTNKSNHKMVVRFQIWLRAQNYLTSTIASYSRVCFGFCDFVGTKPFCEVCPLDVSDFIAGNLPPNWSDNCVNFRLAALRSLFDFLYMGGVIRTLPPRFIHPRKPERKPPHILDQREFAKLLNKTKLLRDRALLEFMYATGCRLTEVLHLRVASVNFVRRTARVSGKRKERIVYFGKPAAKALRKYLNGRKDGYLFQVEYKKQQGHINKTTKTWVGRYAIYLKGKRVVRYRYMGMLHTTGRAQAKARFKRHLEKVDLTRPIPDRPMCKHTAWKILRNAARRVKRDFLPARTVRHSYATHLCENGADIRVIQELLGHSCLSSTQIYIQLANKRIARLYNESHPRR
jgi:site-specific recombinase XerD